MPSDVCALLRRGVDELKGLFAPGQLAMLTATSKVEKPVRDALASFLHARVPGLIVGREVARGDLSVATPELRFLLRGEHKALYSFDAVKANKRLEFRGYIEADRQKLRKVATPGEIQYLLTTMTWLGPGVPKTLEQVVIKYAGDQRRTQQALSISHDELRNRAREEWKAVVADVAGGDVVEWFYDVGDYHGVEVGLDIHFAQLS